MCFAIFISICPSEMIPVAVLLRLVEADPKLLVGVFSRAEGRSTCCRISVRSELLLESIADFNGG